MSACNVTEVSESEMNASRAWFERFQLISSIVIPSVFGVVFIIGLVGNATLVYAIVANKPMRTKSNVLIVSLAAADFLLILVSVPFATLLYTTNGWVFGQVMCKVGHTLIVIIIYYETRGWLGSRVVSVLDSGAEERGFKSQSRRCRVTVSGKLFTPIVPLHQAA